jgi:hypothetical protein
MSELKRKDDRYPTCNVTLSCVRVTIAVVEKQYVLHICVSYDLVFHHAKCMPHVVLLYVASSYTLSLNPLNVELNPICNLLALLGKKVKVSHNRPRWPKGFRVC